MQLLFITRKYPPAIGGMELFAKDLSDALSLKTDLKLISWSGYGQLKAVVAGVPKLAVKSFAALLTVKVDIIHVQDGVLAPLGWLLSRLFRRPFSVVIHGLDITFKNPLYHHVPWAVRRADMVFCISQSAADEAVKRGVDRARICVIPIAVNDTLFDARLSKKQLAARLGLVPTAPILLTVGRLVKRKGAAWFIESVLPDLVRQFPDLVYLLVGVGPEKNLIEAAVSRVKMDSHVRLLGRVEDNLYQLAYNGADVFIMPNVNVPGDMEGFGLVNLEAALCALPVVAANIEGIHDAISDGKNGILVPVQDHTAFINQISALLIDSNRAAEFGRQARSFTLENYNWPAIAEEYIIQYNKIIRGREN